MQVINFSESNSIMNQYMAELRDKKYQQNRLLFRNNIKRVGEMMAFELSKTLEYKSKTVTTPLGTLDIPLPKDEIVVATVLRAGLPFHEGFLQVFDKAENAFVSAYRMYTNREHTEVGIHTEYMASPSVKGKTLIIADPMLATGGSMAAAIEALVKTGKPKQIHVACVIATPEGIDMVKQTLPENAIVWCAAIDPGMNEHKYIVPGLDSAMQVICVTARNCRKSYLSISSIFSSDCSSVQLNFGRFVADSMSLTFSLDRKRLR